MFTYILWRYLILDMFVLVAFSDAKCVYKHPQKQFCTSEFVLVLKFREVIHLPVRYAFRTEIMKIYKGNVDELNTKDDRYVNVVTNEHLDLFAGHKYVIFGRNKNGNIYTDSCNRNIPWKYMRKSYGRILEVFYKYKCDCGYAINLLSACQVRSFFVKRRNKHCSWVKRKYVRLCHKGELDYDAWK